MLRKVLIASVIAATAALGGAVVNPGDAQAGVTVRIGKDHHRGYHHRRCVTDYKTVKTRFYNSRRHAWVVKVVRKPVTRCR